MPGKYRPDITGEKYHPASASLSLTEHTEDRDPYNMMKKMEMPGFWGVKNNNLSEPESGLPGQADIWEIYQTGK